MLTGLGRVVPALDRVSHHPMLSASFYITIKLLDGGEGPKKHNGGHPVYTGMWFHFAVLGNGDTHQQFCLYTRYGVYLLACVFREESQQTGSLMRRCKPHCQGGSKQSEVIGQIKECVNGNVSHWSVPPRNQLIRSCENYPPPPPRIPVECSSSH